MSRRSFNPLRALRRLVVGVVTVAVLVIGVPWLTVQALSFGRVSETAEATPARDVTLVMGAATINGRPSPYLQGRLDVALDLYNEGKTKVIIVSGSISDNEPVVMRNYLVENGVDYQDIVLDEGGNSSYSSCIRAGEKFGVDQLIVVSQAYHVPRTVATCRMVGVDAVGAADTTREQNDTLRSYQIRELFANVKMILDWALEVDAGQGAKDSSVSDALARHS